MATGSHVVPRDTLRILAPISNPDKVICIGMNYVDHCTEQVPRTTSFSLCVPCPCVNHAALGQNLPVPKEPVVFSKFASAISNPGDDIVKAPEVEELDFEVELVIVIGKTAKRVKVQLFLFLLAPPRVQPDGCRVLGGDQQEEDAMDFVAGYTVAHDVSARDWQLKRNGGQWLIGKVRRDPQRPPLPPPALQNLPFTPPCPCRLGRQTFDTYAPIGPAIVSPDELGDPHKVSGDISLPARCGDCLHAGPLFLTRPASPPPFPRSLGFAAA